MPTSMITIFVISLILIAFVLKKLKDGLPRYRNLLPDGRNFTTRLKEVYKEKRNKNNPDDEAVGLGTNRCHFCGHKREPNESTPFALTLLEKEQRICGDCHLFVEYF